MSPSRAPRRRTVLGLAALMLATVALVLAADDPPPTTRGSFQGTWYRREPGLKQALQIRRAPSDPQHWEVRIYWVTDEGFLLDTKWQPHTEINYRGVPITFDVRVDPESSNDDALLVTWSRRQEDKRTRYSESGDVRIYRKGEGRSLVWIQDPLVQESVVKEPIAPYEDGPQKKSLRRAWVLSKASKRLLQWDELPW